MCRKEKKKLVEKSHVLPYDNEKTSDSSEFDVRLYFNNVLVKVE